MNPGHMLQQRYRILALLGQGGMGAVYQAQDLRLNISVAIKELLPQPELDPELLVRLRGQFLQEATVLARLDHPHLVNVSDYFEEGGKSYLVMKFVEGENLADRITREGALDEAQVIAWAEQLLDALGYCHAQGILHRDVKPQNVIITPFPDAGEGRGGAAPLLIGGAGGGAVLADFGLVKLWDPHDPRTKTALRGMGTPEYAPPEQYSTHAGHTDSRSDIYSLGATLYHALAGQAPPSVTDRMAFPQQFKTPRELNGRVSAETDRVIQHAMALPQDARWSSAVEMAAALRGSASSGRDVGRKSPAPQRRIPLWLWGIGAVLLLGLLVSVGRALILLSGDNRPVLGVASTANPPPDTALPTALVVETSAPTFAPTDTDMPAFSPTVEVTAQPLVATPTAEPIATLAPTVISAATATPTVEPAATTTPRCPMVQGPFATVWEAAQERLGCAQGGAFSGLIAEETFEDGKMFWREPIDTAQALVLFNDGTWRIFTHTPYIEGSPEFSCIDANTPAQCPPTPKRGFGMMWCDIPKIRNALGNALDCERGYQGSLQRFDGGSALRTDTGSIYVFYADGSWERR